jgi:predicted glycosyl hydrolase (DUF1957 family)
VPQAVVHDVEVEVHLSGVFGFEAADFQIDDNEAAKAEVVKEEVDVEIVVANIQMDLPAHVCEAGAEFYQEVLKVTEQAGFEFALMKGPFQREKSKR